MFNSSLWIDAIDRLDERYLERYFTMKQRAAHEKKSKRIGIVTAAVAVAACLALLLASAPMIVKLQGDRGEGSERALIQRMQSGFPSYEELAATMGEDMPLLEDSVLPMKNSQGEVEITANQLVGHISLSAWFPLRVRIDNESIYIRDTLYDVVTYAESFDLKYDEGQLEYAEASEGIAGSILQMLREHKGCYLLDIKGNTAWSKRTVIYDVNDTFYFLSFNDQGELLRVHAAPAGFKQILIGQWESAFGAVDPETGDKVTRFTAAPFIQGAVSWVYALDISVNNGQIYLGKVLYDKVTYTKELAIRYTEDFALPGQVDASIMAALDAIQQHKGCYLLETDAVTRYGQRVAVYNIDDVYYFVSFDQNGAVLRIHSINEK